MTTTKKARKPAAENAKKPAAKKPAAKKPVAKRVAADYASLFRAAAKADGSKPTDAAVSTGASDKANAARIGIASHDRVSGPDRERSAKHTLFAEWLKRKPSEAFVKTLRVFNRKQNKMVPVKASTVASWQSNWRRGIAGGAFYPTNDRAEIAKAIARDTGCSIANARKLMIL